MKQLIPVLWLLTLGMTFGQSNVQQSVKAFVHPGMAQTRVDLDFIKQKVGGGEQPWKGQTPDHLLQE